MKIKSIKLTNEHEMKNRDSSIAYFGFSRDPIFEIEYEETTPTGLKATGTMLLEEECEEMATKLFSQLENNLSMKISEESDKKDTGFLDNLRSHEGVLEAKKIKAILDSVQLAKEAIKNPKDKSSNLKNGSKETTESNLFDTIYDIYIQAIKNTDEEKATELVSNMLKALNKTKNSK